MEGDIPGEIDFPAAIFKLCDEGFGNLPDRRLELADIARHKLVLGDIPVLPVLFTIQVYQGFQDIVVAAGVLSYQVFRGLGNQHFRPVSVVEQFALAADLPDILGFGHDPVGVESRYFGHGQRIVPAQAGEDRVHSIWISKRARIENGSYQLCGYRCVHCYT